jgi:transcriptional regulator with XRE-family HTH domain
MRPSGVDRAQLGANIRAARKAAGLTGKDLAERLEVSAVAVSQFELGTSMPAVTTFAAIAEVLGVPYGVLFAYAVRCAHCERAYRMPDTFQLAEDPTVGELDAVIAFDTDRPADG